MRKKALYLMPCFLVLSGFICSEKNVAPVLQKVSDSGEMRTFMKLDFNTDGTEDVWVIILWDRKAKEYVALWFAVPDGNLQLVTRDNGKRILMWQPSFDSFEEIEQSKIPRFRLPYELESPPRYLEPAVPTPGQGQDVG